jgi:hypothetical protein
MHFPVYLTSQIIEHLHSINRNGQKTGVKTAKQSNNPPLNQNDQISLGSQIDPLRNTGRNGNGVLRVLFVHQYSSASSTMSGRFQGHKVVQRYAKNSQNNLMNHEITASHYLFKFR